MINLLGLITDYKILLPGPRSRAHGDFVEPNVLENAFLFNVSK